MYIYDIGANVGKFAEVAFQLYPEAHVVMVEPNERIAQYLATKFRNKAATVIERVVSKVSDVEVDFYISNADTISTASTEWVTNSRFTGKYNWQRTIKKTITIDKILEKFPSPQIIKIDVEGYEFEAIQGLTKKQNKICFEWAEEQEHNVRSVVEYLENLGYDQFGFIHGDEYLVEPKTWLTGQECLKQMDMKPERKETWGMVWSI
jgi:FkbM family methyltransferase